MSQSTAAQVAHTHRQNRPFPRYDKPTRRVAEAAPALATRVLIVEDDEELRRLVAQTLEEAGYLVEQVEDGVDFLRHMCASWTGRSHLPDLIVTDQRMPGMSGLAVVEAIRRVDWSMPVILITAFPDQPLEDEAHRLGVVGMLDKPFELADLVALVAAQIPPSF